MRTSELRQNIRRAAVALSAGVLATTGLIATTSAPASAGQVRLTYDTPGTYTWTVPQGVNSLGLTVYGAQGADAQWVPSEIGIGGLGARILVSVAVSPGQELTFVVGGEGSGSQGGYGGGGDPGYGSMNGGGGGGASRVTLSGRTLAVAGGGGGGAVGPCHNGALGCYVNGGGSGQPGTGVGGPYDARGGGAGNQTGAGAGGTGGSTAGLPCRDWLSGPGTNGDPGMSGSGGHGGDMGAEYDYVVGGGGGGGGGGYFGGGGGGAGAWCSGSEAKTPGSGGGGSSFIANTDPAILGGSFTERNHSDNGMIIVDYQDTLAPVAAPAVSPAPNAFGWNNTNVTVSWNWTDQGSGINTAQCTQSTSLQTAGVALLSAGCTDLSGNAGNAQKQVLIDKVAPVADPSVGSNGVVTWHWYDAQSGVRPSQCPAATASVPGQPTVGTCADKAGNTGGATVP